jgi:hypothetical protein
MASATTHHAHHGATSKAPSSHHRSVKTKHAKSVGHHPLHRNKKHTKPLAAFHGHHRHRASTITATEASPTSVNATTVVNNTSAPVPANASALASHTIASESAAPDTTASDADSSVPSVQQQIVDFTQKTINNLRYSTYKLGGTRFDPAHGVYVVDCSHYVDHILHAAYPHAYSSLVQSTGADTPNSENYYHFLATLPDQNVSNWDKVESVDALQPGDILVIRYQNRRQVAVGGHVMIVMNKPVQTMDAYLVQVADSARTGHSSDTRHHSGIGMGTLLLKADPSTGQPYAYAWKAGSYWQDNVSFAMGRPV